MLVKAPKGTKDIVPEQTYKWHFIENKIREITKAFGYNEIRTPIFEHTELFLRGVGDTTDIVQKEMYTFEDKGKRSITLKPEGTAPVVRAFIENKLYALQQPTKMYYMTPAFRYERPQAGRLREFHQFGVEAFGGELPSLDAEIIILAKQLLHHLGVEHVTLNINSIGCPTCRPIYLQKLKEYFGKNKETLCKTCNERLEKNPLRILDCKVESCRDVIKDAPLITESLCEECETHFAQLQHYLTDNNISFQVNPMIVRGLDYYTKTVFEFISDAIGAQGTVCGGGRYDGLVKECGGNQTPGIGFGMGLERLMMVMEAEGVAINPPQNDVVYLVGIGEKAQNEAFKIALQLREAGISAEVDHVGRSFKAQFKYADKQKFKYVIVIGDDELENQTVSVRNMNQGTEDKVKINNIINFFKQ